MKQAQTRFRARRLRCDHRLRWKLARAFYAALVLRFTTEHKS